MAAAVEDCAAETDDDVDGGGLSVTACTINGVRVGYPPQRALMRLLRKAQEKSWPSSLPACNMGPLSEAG